jgi:hypothetical protein
MSSRPPTGQPDLGAKQEGAGRDEFFSVRTLSHQAQQVNADLDLRISGSRPRKLFVGSSPSVAAASTSATGYSGAPIRPETGQSPTCSEAVSSVRQPDGIPPVIGDPVPGDRTVLLEPLDRGLGTPPSATVPVPPFAELIRRVTSVVSPSTTRCSTWTPVSTWLTTSSRSRTVDRTRWRTWLQRTGCATR